MVFILTLPQVECPSLCLKKYSPCLKKNYKTFVNRNETAVTLQHVTSSGLKLLTCDSKVTHLRQGSYSPAIEM